MSSGAPGKIAYVLKGFPRLSETFIANEIYRLEEMGTRLHLFSIKGGDSGKAHAVVDSIKAPLVYLPQVSSLSATTLRHWLRQNLAVFSARHRHLFARRPLRYLHTLALAIRMSRKYRSAGSGAPRKVFIKEFLQAGDIAARILDDSSIQHIHGHFCHGATTITYFVSRLTGLPFSFTAHAKDIYVKDLNPGDLLARKLSAAQFVVTCTFANARHLNRLYPDCNTVHAIYHGLDTEMFRPRHEVSNPVDVPLIISVGRFVEKKGFTYLVDACDRLRNTRREFRCLIVGEHGDNYDAVRRRIDELGLGEHVSLQGPVTQQELRELYLQADVFALPCQILASGDRDGIPNVLAEAMASGLPIVSTGISGIPELVADGVEGFLVPERDSSALARRIGKLLDDAQLRQQMGQGARQRICASFDSRKTTIALNELFNGALPASREAA